MQKQDQNPTIRVDKTILSEQSLEEIRRLLFDYYHPIELKSQIVKMSTYSKSEEASNPGFDYFTIWLNDFTNNMFKEIGE